MCSKKFHDFKLNSQHQGGGEGGLIYHLGRTIFKLIKSNIEMSSENNKELVIASNWIH